MPERGQRATTRTEPGRGPPTNITEQHRHAFDALTSGVHGNFALLNVFVNNQRAAAIVAVTAHDPHYEGDEIEFHIEPLLVSMVDGLVVTDHDGREA